MKFKAVPFGDIPVACYQEARPMMRTVENVKRFPSNNIIDAGKFPVNVNMKGYEEVYKGAPPAAKGHNLFTSDDAIIDEVLKRFEKLLKKENL